jgi:hypothetical protein
MNLELKEIVLTFQTVVRALCKVVSIVPPPLQVLEEAANNLYTSVDQDFSGAISYRELEDWVLSDIELQDFLLKYAAMQTFVNAERRGLARMETYA